MRSLISHLILPLSVFWLLILAAIFLFKLKKTKAFPTVFILSFTWLAAVSTPFLPDLLVASFENKYKVFQTEELLTGQKPGSGNMVNILVLGGGYYNDTRLPATNQMMPGTLSRLAEGIRLHRLIPNSTLVTSGWAGKNGIAQALVNANAAMLLGIDSSHIKMQTTPENTWREATEYKRLFGDTATLVVVTSAVHMPRAMYLFKKAGLNPYAAPSDHLVKKDEYRDPWYGMPSSQNIKKTESFIHEYIGLLWYKMNIK